MRRSFAGILSSRAWSVASWMFGPRPLRPLTTSSICCSSSTTWLGAFAGRTVAPFCCTRIAGLRSVASSWFRTGDTRGFRSRIACSGHPRTRIATFASTLGSQPSACGTRAEHNALIVALARAATFTQPSPLSRHDTRETSRA